MSRGSAMHVQSISTPKSNTCVETDIGKQPISDLHAELFSNPRMARPSLAARAGVFKRAPVRVEPRSLRPTSWRAPARARSEGGIRAIRGALSFGVFSLVTQRKETIYPALKKH